MPVKKAAIKNSTHPNKNAERKASSKVGRLISFEGPEGSGKTTQISRLATHLQKEGYDVLVTHEPGGTPVGEEIRHLLKHAHSGTNMCPETELLLFAASRAQLVRELILPAIEEGKIVLCDRFLDSTTVFQGAARQLSNDTIQMINAFTVGKLIPTLTLVLDTPPEVSMQRVKLRTNDIPDRMEKENIEFYKRVRKGYLVLAKSIPNRFHVIDATQERRDIEQAIWNEVRDRFL